MPDTKHPKHEDQLPDPPKSHTDDPTKTKPKFEPPKVITYSGDDILEELGPAHACNPFSGAVVGCS